MGKVTKITKKNFTPIMVKRLRRVQKRLLSCIEELKHISEMLGGCNELEHYIIPHLETSTHREHEYLNSSDNLDDVIENLESEDDE